MLNWNEYHNQLFGRVAELSRPSHDTVAGYQTLSAAGKKTARLGDKTGELMPWLPICSTATAFCPTTRHWTSRACPRSKCQTGTASYPIRNSASLVIREKGGRSWTP
jgi:hypothetical protein